MSTLFAMGGKIGTTKIAGDTTKPGKFFQLSKVLLNRSNLIDFWQKINILKKNEHFVCNGRKNWNYRNTVPNNSYHFQLSIMKMPI
jgi:hypothetical protein